MNKWIKPGSMGKAAPGYDVRIVNNMGSEVARGQQGNIGVKVSPEMPPGLFSGYTEDAVATSNAFVGDFYLTGDRGVQDSVLHSHWSRSNEAQLSLVEKIVGYYRHLYAIKNQWEASKIPLF